MSEYRFVNGPRTGETITVPEGFHWPLRAASTLYADSPYDVLYWPRDDITRGEIVLSTERKPVSPERVRELFA